MYPNLPQDNKNQPISVDYLNQISTTNTKKPFFGSKTRLLSVFAISCVVITILLSVASLLIKSDNKIEILAARLTSINSIAEDSSLNLKNTQIRATNSNLKIFLTNTVRDITPILKSNDINIDNLDKKILETESDQELVNRLEDARLNAVFDRTYAREMAYKLDLTLSLMKQIYQTTNNTELRQTLTDAYNNLEPTQESFANFNATNS